MELESLLFADDIAQLSSSAEGLQQALDKLAAGCSDAGMRISTAKTEVMAISRTSVQCDLHVSGSSLKQAEKFKYLGVEFSSEPDPHGSGTQLDD